MYGKWLRAEQEYYSDQLRERGIAECEWHEGRPKQECPECEQAFDAYCDLQIDAYREDMASRE